MSDDLEDRLRRALAARAEVVSSSDLRPAAPPPAPHRSRGPFLVTGLALAAAAAAAGVFVLGGGWSPGGGTTVAVPAGWTATGTSGTTGATPDAADGGSPTSPTTSAAPSPTVTLCSASAVSVFVLPDTDTRRHGGGMNHQGATIGLTNTGAMPCRLTGYPGVALRQGTTMESEDPNTRGSTSYAQDPGPSTVVLPVGGSAYAEVSWTSADGVRPATSVDTLQVILPDQRTVLTAPLTSVLGGDRTLTVTALTPIPLPLNGSGG